MNQDRSQKTQAKVVEAEELKIEGPISEKDEVKAAERKLNKPRTKPNAKQGK